MDLFLERHEHELLAPRTAGDRSVRRFLFRPIPPDLSDRTPHGTEIFTLTLHGDTAHVVPGAAPLPGHERLGHLVTRRDAA